MRFTLGGWHPPEYVIPAWVVCACTCVHVWEVHSIASFCSPWEGPVSFYHRASTQPGSLEAFYHKTSPWELELAPRSSAGTCELYIWYATEQKNVKMQQDIKFKLHTEMHHDKNVKMQNVKKRETSPYWASKKRENASWKKHQLPFLKEQELKTIRFWFCFFDFLWCERILLDSVWFELTWSERSGLK